MRVSNEITHNLNLFLFRKQCTHSFFRCRKSRPAQTQVVPAQSPSPPRSPRKYLAPHFTPPLTPASSARPTPQPSPDIRPHQPMARVLPTPQQPALRYSRQTQTPQRQPYDTDTYTYYTPRQTYTPRQSYRPDYDTVDYKGTMMDKDEEEEGEILQPIQQRIEISTKNPPSVAYVRIQSPAPPSPAPSGVISTSPQPGPSLPMPQACSTPRKPTMSATASARPPHARTQPSQPLPAGPPYLTESVTQTRHYDISGFPNDMSFTNVQVRRLTDPSSTDIPSH